MDFETVVFLIFTHWVAFNLGLFLEHFANHRREMKKLEAQ